MSATIAATAANAAPAARWTAGEVGLPARHAVGCWGCRTLLTGPLPQAMATHAISTVGCGTCHDAARPAAVRHPAPITVWMTEDQYAALWRQAQRAAVAAPRLTSESTTRRMILRGLTTEAIRPTR